jgi:cell division protein FtsN
MIELVDGTDAVPQVATTESKSALAPEPEATPPPSTSARIFLQAGAFNDAAGAERLRRDLTDVVGDDVHVQHRPADRLYRVRIGPVALMSEATRLQALIAAAAFAKPLIVRE